MSLTLEQKKVVVAEIAEVAARSPTAIAAEYIGLSVAELSKLRQSAREAGIFLKVVRNTLAKRALEGTSFECMREGLVGPLLLAFSNEEPGSAAKVIREFSKSNEKLVVKLVSIDGRLLDAAGLERLASLPSQDEARAMLLGLFKAPAGKFVRVLAEPGGKFARLLAARRDQQQAA
ncbi:MAG: 50S ribosomal protein L10 [Gammaproteobacteria bacterium]